MKLTKCDICGTVEGWMYYMAKLPYLQGRVLDHKTHDVCEGCIKKIVAFIESEKESHGMGVTRL